MLATIATVLAIVTDASAASTPTRSTIPPGQTLNHGFKWIRNVNSDLYLQGNPPRSIGPAVIGNSDNGGQFLIAGGNLVQLTVRAPAPRYTYTYVDKTTGALMFGAGDFAPPGSGTFSWTPLDKALNWRDSSGNLYTTYMFCSDNRIYVPLMGLSFGGDCTEGTLKALSTIHPLKF